MDTAPKSEATGRKGINWLSLIGIIILIILIVIVLYFAWVGTVAMKNPLVQQFVEIEPAIVAMQDMTQAQIEDQAAHLDAVTLGDDPYGFGGRYVVVTGTVNKEESIHVEQNIARNVFGETNYKGFVLDNAVVLIDITGEAPDVVDGTLIKGFGKVFVLELEDLWDLPIVGKDLEQSFAGVEYMSDRVVFHISKGVEIVEAPAPPEPTEAEMEAEEAIEGEEAMEGEEEAPVDEEEAPAEEPEEEMAPEEEPVADEEAENPCAPAEG